MTNYKCRLTQHHRHAEILVNGFEWTGGLLRVYCRKWVRWCDKEQVKINLVCSVREVFLRLSFYPEEVLYQNLPRESRSVQYKFGDAQLCVKSGIDSWEYKTHSLGSGCSELHKSFQGSMGNHFKLTALLSMAVCQHLKTLVAAGPRR